MKGMEVGPDLLPLLPQLAVAITAVVALMADMARRPRIGLILTIGGLLVATALAAARLGQVTTIFTGTYQIDPLSSWAVLILAPVTALVALLARPEVRGRDREGTIYSLFAFTTLGALVLAGAGDLLFLVLGVLLASLGSFALVAFPHDERATEAAMKYFVFSTVTGGVMIFGLTYWFGATGSTLLADLPRLRGMPLPAAAGMTAVLIGLGYKAALAPLHFWAPDAYDGAPVAVAAFLSIVPKIGAIFALAQVARDLPVRIIDWPAAVAVLAVVSMTYGNLAALGQTNLVRLLAYSSIAQSGYFLLGVVGMGHGTLPIQALVVFAAAYAAMNLGAFAVVAWVGRELAAYEGLGRAAPWTGAAMTIFLLSLVGVPPLAGFAGKLLLFGAAIDAGYTWLAVAAILNSVLSLAVYLRVVAPMYRSTAGSAASRLAVSGPIFWVGGLALSGTVVLGVGVQILLARIA